MPWLYIYSPDDFVGGLPDEQGGAAAGSPPFTLTLKPGATPTAVEVTDDDLLFDEIDYGQTLTNAIDLDGTSYAAGTTIHSAYDLINTATGHKVTTLHFGGDGYEQGPVHGLVSTVELQPGQSYSFNTERTSYQQNNPYSDYVACFATGTRIATPRGEVPIEALRPGDPVDTENGPREVLWIGNRSVRARGAMAPIRFGRGAIGNHRPLLVSPEHRIRVASARAELFFGAASVLVAAKHFVAAGLARRRVGGQVTYWHLALEEHAIVHANGAAAESFLPSPVSIAGMGPAARRELLTLFPDVLDEVSAAARARQRACLPVLRNHEARLLLAA